MLVLGCCLVSCGFWLGWFCVICIVWWLFGFWLIVLGCAIQMLISLLDACVV